MILDSLPNNRVGPELTPTLWSLIQQGGWHPDGGISVLASSTYPNHATFTTGVDVAEHRIFTNDVWNGSEFVCSSTVGPAIATIFDWASAAGISTAAITGDDTMVGCMGARGADVVWPPPGVLPSSIARDCLGYAANSAVIENLAGSGALDTDLLYVHVNDPDSTLHFHGPEAAETLTRIREIDDDLATVVDLLAPRWDETVLFVVSDHEQEAVDQRLPPVDLAKEMARAGMPGDAHNEGTVGLVHNSPGAAIIEALAPIRGAVDLDVGVTLAWSDPGRVFGAEPSTLNGQHGSPRTRAQVATVAGGHRVVKGLAEQISRGFGSAHGRPAATSYANVIAELFAMNPTAEISVEGEVGQP